MLSRLFYLRAEGWQVQVATSLKELVYLRFLDSLKGVYLRPMLSPRFCFCVILNTRNNERAVEMCAKCQHIFLQE